MSEVTTVDLSKLGLLPRLAALTAELRELAWQQGIDTTVTPNSGLRSNSAQWALFREGRQLVNGFWVAIDPVHRIGIVTGATPAKAPHCGHVDEDGTYGSAAVDLPIIVDGKIAWEVGHPGYDMYSELGVLGEDLGLAWGGRWGKLADLDHFELADWRSLPSGPVPRDSQAA